MKRQLVKGVLLTAVLAFGSGLCPASLIGSAQAQTKEMLHQQAKDPANAVVHAQGTDPDYSKSFFERYAPPKDITSFGTRIDWLFKYTSGVTFLFFVIMASCLIGFVYIFRDRPGHKAVYSHGGGKRETMITKTLDIAVFLSLDLVLIIASYRDTRDFVWNYPKTEDTVKVMVMPQQWAWNFRYAGADGAFNTPDDVITVNDLRVPKGKPVMVQMKSRDVIHGFMIPNARMQMDAIPGTVTKFWFDTNTAGDFEIACYHMCGTAHYKMKAFLKVLEEQDYKDWLQEQSVWASAKFDPEDTKTHWGWNWGL